MGSALENKAETGFFAQVCVYIKRPSEERISAQWSVLSVCCPVPLPQNPFPHASPAPVPSNLLWPHTSCWLFTKYSLKPVG